MHPLRQGKHLIILAILALAGAAHAEPIAVRYAVLELSPAAPPELRLGRIDSLRGLISASSDGACGSYSGLAVEQHGRVPSIGHGRRRKEHCRNCGTRWTPH